MEKVKVIEEGYAGEPQKDYFSMSVVSFFFCPLFGLLAIWKSGKTRDQLRKGDEWSAELAAMDALKWSMAAIVIGGAIYFIAVLLAIYYWIAFVILDAESPFLSASLRNNTST